MVRGVDESNPTPVHRIGEDPAGHHAALERSLALVPLHQAFASSYLWIPVMVLFTRARFDLDGALLLASLYYLFVVALEVPSGWMSDRFGRVGTLRVAAFSWIVAQSCFLIGDTSFAMIAAGQFFMAAGFASLSGTDVTFHYDTLEALGRASTYTARQARISAIGYGATAVSAVIGGLLGLIDIRLAFAGALVVALVQFGVTLRFVEPDPRPRRVDGGPHPEPSVSAEGIFGQVWRCLGYLRQRFLGWIFFYGIIMVTLEHVAVTVLQPWLTELVGNSAADLGATPLLSGLVYGAVSLAGAAAARASAPLSQRFGAVVTLIGLAALSAIVVTGMALWVNAVVVVLVLFRSVQGAAAPVLISAAVAPRVERHHRATLLSLNSLAGRLGYGLILLTVSAAIVDDVQRVLRIFSVLAWSMVGVLILSALAIRGGDGPEKRVVA